MFASLSFHELEKIRKNHKTLVKKIVNLAVFENHKKSRIQHLTFTILSGQKFIKNAKNS